MVAREAWGKQNSGSGGATACRAVALLAAAVALVRVAVTIPTFTNTADEPFHLAAAVALWDQHQHTLGVEHPPLPRLVAGLPLYLAGVRLPPKFAGNTVRGEQQWTLNVAAAYTILFGRQTNLPPGIAVVGGGGGPQVTAVNQNGARFRVHAPLLELTKAGTMISNATFRPFVVYACVALMYFALCWPISAYSHHLERKLRRA